MATCGSICTLPRRRPQEGKTPYFRLVTGKLGDWDACNPQALLYVNGRTVQGMDINHNMMQLTPGQDIDLYIYFYIGMIDIAVEFTPSLVYLDDRIEKAYYDLTVPLQGTRLLQKNSRELCGNHEVPGTGRQPACDVAGILRSLLSGA